MRIAEADRHAGGLGDLGVLRHPLLGPRSASDASSPGSRGLWPTSLRPVSAVCSPRRCSSTTKAVLRSTKGAIAEPRGGAARYRIPSVRLLRAHEGPDRAEIALRCGSDRCGVWWRRCCGAVEEVGGAEVVVGPVSYTHLTLPTICSV